MTPGRVGIDFDLDRDGEVHERKRLIEVLGRDAVLDTAEEHRAAVDRALLGIGPDRHRKLVGLIRVLRRPQLAGKLDLDLLSEVLSSGLPGLGDDVLDEIASSLDDLETTQRELADVQAALATVETFLPVYATYLQGEAARRVTAVRTAERDRRAALDRGEAARTALDRIDAEVASNEEDRQRVDLDLAATDAEKIAVIESPAFKDASSLRELEDIDHPGRGAPRGSATADGRGGRRPRPRRRCRSAGRQGPGCRAPPGRGGAHRPRRRRRRGRPGLDAAHRGRHRPRDPRRRGRAAERARRDDLRTVLASLRDRDKTAADHQARQHDAADARAAADTAEARAAELDDEVAEQRTALAARVEAWVGTAPQLGTPRASWTTSPTSANRVRPPWPTGTGPSPRRSATNWWPSARNSAAVVRATEATIETLRGAARQGGGRDGRRPRAAGVAHRAPDRTTGRTAVGVLRLRRPPGRRVAAPGSRPPSKPPACSTPGFLPTEPRSTATTHGWRHRPGTALASRARCDRHWSPPRLPARACPPPPWMPSWSRLRSARSASPSPPTAPSHSGRSTAGPPRWRPATSAPRPAAAAGPAACRDARPRVGDTRSTLERARGRGRPPRRRAARRSTPPPRPSRPPSRSSKRSPSASAAHAEARARAEGAERAARPRS